MHEAVFSSFMLVKSELRLNCILQFYYTPVYIFLELKLHHFCLSNCGRLVFSVVHGECLKFAVMQKN